MLHSQLSHREIHQPSQTDYKHSIGKEINGALGFAMNYNEIRQSSKLNPTLLSSNVSLDTMSEDPRSRNNMSFRNEDPSKSTVAARQIVEQAQSSIRQINMIEISGDENINVRRPAMIFSRQPPIQKQISNISLVRSQYLTNELAPIDETNSFANQNSEDHSFEDRRVLETMSKVEESRDSKNNDKYVIKMKNKEYATRHWEKKFQAQPEIPVKVVTFHRKTSHSPLRDSQKQGSLQTSSYNQSQLLKVETSKKGWEERLGEEDGSTQPGSANSNDNQYAFVVNKSLPYFQYSFKKKQFDGRPQSPTSARDMNLKELIDSEILNMSKGMTSPSKASPGFLSSSSNMSPGRSAVDLLSASRKTNSPSRESSYLGTKSQSKAIITDASKRYRMPKTQNH